MKTLAFVIPWYHANIGGGAETALRGLVCHLQEAGVDLEILTTCVQDFRADWNVNYFPAGDDVCDGIRVKRFPVRERNTTLFDQVNLRLMNNFPISSVEEEHFVREMINSPDLYRYIQDHQSDYGLFIFTPYMFGPTYYGVQECYEKAVVIPCLHDESYAYMDVFRKVFSKVAGMIFLSEPERKLAEGLYGVSGSAFRVLGTGMETDYVCNAETFRTAHGIYSPFMLYAGRKDQGKRVDELVSHFIEYKKRNPSDMKLVLIGGGEIDLPSDEILDLGFLDEQDKMNAYAAAEIFCNPSDMESFSIVIMESWLAETPALVNGNCAVTRDFVRAANAGLYYENYEDFEGCVNYLRTHRNVAKQMGRNGRAYVLDNFSWDSIVRKYCGYFEFMVNPPRGGRTPSRKQPYDKH